MDIRNMPWIGKTLEVVTSTDPSYVGRSGLVLHESRRMVKLQEGDKEISLPKQEITFKINESKTIQGHMVNKRPEDRINYKFRW